MRILLFFSVLAVAGCGRGAQFAPVSGKVTLDGAPLADAVVSFQPVGGGDQTSFAPGSAGRTGPDGVYKLSVIVMDQDGAMIGKHNVTISALSTGTTAPDETTKVTQDRVPEKYQAAGALTFEVPAGGTDAANFDLTSK